MSTVTQENLSRGLDAVERNARGQLVADDRSKAMQRHLPWALWLLPVVPALALVWQIIRWSSGQSVGWFSFVGLTVAAIAVPAIALLVRTYSGSAFVGRKRALIAMDRTLGSADRLATADEFLRTESPNGFQQAAIADAAAWVEDARTADIETKAKPANVRRRLAIVAPASLLLLLAAFGVSGLEQAQATLPGAEEPSASNNVVTAEQSTSEQPEPAAEPEPPKKKAALPAKEGKRPSKRVAAPVSSIPDEAEDSRGKLAEGESSESQQSSSPSNAQGAPSSQGQPSKATAKEEKKKKKNKQKPKENKRETRKQEKKEEEPSGATAGQGSSRGNSNNAAANDWSSKTQQSTPDEEDPDSDEDAEDDDEEQESRGGVQPNMRDRRSPVNRDLNIGLGNARPNPDANGRGGPGGQKKSRGVASMVLGVPIPDRITGQPNKGRTRITQQRITPEAEDTNSVPAEDRGRRNGSVGPIHHPDFSPWLQNHVKNYFLKRRASANQKKTDEGTTSREGTASKPVGQVTPKQPAGDA